MSRLAFVLGTLALAAAAVAEEPHTPAAAVPADAADVDAGGAGAARKRLADFFLRTRGMTRVVPASEVLESIRTGSGKYVVVDVRPPEEYEKGHVPGAISLPIDVLFRPASLAQLPSGGKPIVLVCQSGHVESMALGGLAALGYEPYAMRFGMIGWSGESKVKAGSPGQAADIVRGVGGPVER
jgi:rhodanese-related sulfurtransferase